MDSVASWNCRHVKLEDDAVEIYVDAEGEAAEDDRERPKDLKPHVAEATRGELDT